MDTSVVIAGISGFKAGFFPGRNSSADVLGEWVEKGSFIWLITDDILQEYKELAKRLKVRPHIAGRLINLLQEEAEEVAVKESIDISRDPGDNTFCGCAEAGGANFLITLNPRDFPQRKLSARVVSPTEFHALMRRRRGIR